MSRVFSVKLGALDLTAYPFMVLWDSLDQGAPENVTEVLDSFLQDGELEVSSGTGNRVLSWTVGIEGTDLLALATAEAALIAETDKQQNLLTITPGDGVAPASVYETFRAALTFVRSEAGEDGNLRRYTITLRALPWARSVAEVVVPAVGTGATPAAPTITVVDDCTATTGWARGGSATTGPTVVTGAVTVGFTATLPAGVTISGSADRTGLSANMSTTRYLRVTASQIQSGFLNPGGLTFLVNGAVKAPTATSGGAYYLDCFGMTVTSLSVIGKWIGVGYTGGTVSVRVDDVSRTDQIPAIGTLRQMQRTIAISGSAPTQATLAIEHLTSTLGDVMAYVYKNDNAAYSPSLRQYRSGGGTVTADTTLVSGAREVLSGLPTFDIPYSALPAGNYEILIRCAATTTTAVQTVNWQAENRYPASYTILGTGSASISTVLSSQKIYSLGRVMLPGNLAPNSSSFVRMNLSSATGANVTLDEVWLFNLSIGKLTRFNAGIAAGLPTRAWLTPASVTNGGVPSILLGLADDQSDAIAPFATAAWMPPQFVPPSVGLFTVTTNALNVAASARYFPRWHTNAAS